MKEKIIAWLGTLPGGIFWQNKYLISLVIFLLFILLAWLVLWIFGKYLERFARRTKTRVDDLIFDHTKRPLFYLVIALGLKLALLNLEVNGGVQKFVNSIMVVVFVIIILRIVDVLLEVWGEVFAKQTKTKVDEVLLPVVHKSTTVLAFVISFIWILKIWEINITPYLAGVGISGLILGLALQDMLKNIFGGVSIILDKNFKVGDPIRIETGELGTVEDIGLRSTKIKTYDGEILFVPNGQLSNMKLRNYVKPNTRVRKIVEFGVTYGSNVEKVKKVVLATLKKINDIYDDPYMDVIFVKMDAYSLNFQARFWVDWNNAYKKWVEATELIYDALKKAKISIPFPTRTVYLKK